MTTPVDIDKLKADYAALGIDPGVEWYALIHKGGYDLCLENAKWRRGSGNGDDIVGRFACGEYAIKCLPVVAQALNALPALIAKAERVDALEHALKITREALCEHACHAGIEVPCIRTRDQCQSECGKSAGDVIVAVDKILCPGAAARNALSPKESE